MPTLHQTFTTVTIHTAKCDICNQHNRSVLFRCADCGWHVCTPCWTEKGGDGTHVMNEGARGWRGAGAGIGRGTGAGAGAETFRRGEEERRGRNRRPRRDGDGASASRDPLRVEPHRRPVSPPPISVAAAADLLIQAASRASPSPSPSLSPPPPFRRHSPSAHPRPSGRAAARPGGTASPSASVGPTAATGARATRPSASVSASARASASRREKANISRLLRAAETIDRSSAAPPLPVPVRSSRGEGRAASPLFVEEGLVEVVEESVSDDNDGDDEMTGTGREMGMSPEPPSPDDEMGDEMREASPGQVLEVGDEGRRLMFGPSRVPVPGTGESEMMGPKGRRGEGGVSRRPGKDDAGTKVPVAKRLRELYQSAVLVKDRKGRMRRLDGGLVGRREGI